MAIACFVTLYLLASASSPSTLASSGQYVSSQNNGWFCRHKPRAAGFHLTAIRGGDNCDGTENGSADATGPASQQSKLHSLLSRAEQFLSEKDANGAFAVLAEAYLLDPTSSRIASMFQTCMKINVESAQQRFNIWSNKFGDDNAIEFSEVELTNLFQDRMGLASLFIDKEQYDEAGLQLRKAIEESSLWLNHALNLDIRDMKNGELPDLSSTPFQHWQPQIDHAQYLLYRTNAACCKWDTYFQDGDKLRYALEHKTSSAGSMIRLLHPFDALKFPSISLELASKIAQSYAHRALESVGVTVNSDMFQVNDDDEARKVVIATRASVTHANLQSRRRIRLGYLSPDFTSRHPLAFLMQHVFRYHDKSKFSVHIYSLSSNNGEEGPEVKAIRQSSDSFTYLSSSGMSPVQIYQRIMEDELEILVDLCGYAGTSIVAEIMASRCKLQQEMNKNCGQSDVRFPKHVNYMGFPGSVGCRAIWDYSVFDAHVIPPSMRNHYLEALVYMPHCYFVNSHKTVVGAPEDGFMLANDNDRTDMRMKYAIHPSAFVYCCHSRPDKIDPSTFRSWMRALCVARAEQRKRGVEEEALPVLWLLRSGQQMEKNLRKLVLNEFGIDAEKALVFADVAERREHLKRLGCSDVFLDTPAYNAHTLGCDALYMGVPMVSLLLSDSIQSGDKCMADVDLTLDKLHSPENRFIPTNKLASKVGASLLYAISCDEFVVRDMQAYENLMVKCVVNTEWLDAVRKRLRSSRNTSPLFDTFAWVNNLETAFLQMIALQDELPDIVVLEEEQR